MSQKKVKQNIVAIVQARMGSERLPGKVMTQVARRPLIDHVISKLKPIPQLSRIVLATSVVDQDQPLADWAESAGVDCYRGDENDVLGRYYKAALQFEADHILRICGDCPLFGSKVGALVVEKHLESGADYTANIVKRTYPRGWDAEIFTMETLTSAYKEARHSTYREHVTPYIWQHPNRFRLNSVEAEGVLRRPELRICVDTLEDFKLIKLILEALDRAKLESTEENILFVIDQHPDWPKINQNVTQKKLNLPQTI